MTSLRFIAASLRHYRRIHLAVALGVAVATGVLTGALLVGDSVRGSLHDLTLERLGYIDSALVAGHMFRAALADELAADADFQKFFWTAEPAILMSGTLQAGSGDKARRATAVSIIGCRNSFGELRYGTAPSIWATVAAAPPSVPDLNGDQIAITEPLARELGATVGDDVLLRLPMVRAIPSDSLLGEKNDTSLARRVKVFAVLGAKGQPRFSLVPSQHLPRNVFIPLETLQSLLEKPNSANAILVAAELESPSGEAAQQALQKALRPTLADYGVRVEHITEPTEYVQISADNLVLPDEIVRAAQRAFAGEQLQPVVTYLANSISVGTGESQRKIPYSTISGVDSVPQLGPLLDDTGQPIVLADDEIALNRWAADDLEASVGERITVNFYEPESTHGQLREHAPPPVFKLKAIVPLTDAAGTPTPAADPNLTPELAGVTDQASINDWELPFELVERIRSQDEDYWDEYRTTPKAFVSLATAKRLWPSRWGTISLFRLSTGTGADGVAASASMNIEKLLAAEIDPAELGMAFQPVKQHGLAAASGTTPFGWLFLGFSFFLIAAALMLIALLFQLGVQQRARELGTLTAVGVGKKRIMRLLSRETLVVAAAGATVGIVLGIGYAGIMIAGLRTWWLDAIATPFLKLHIAWTSVIIGWIAGIVVSWLTIVWSIRRLVRQPAARLLAGYAGGEPRSPEKARSMRAGWPIVRIALLLLVALLVVLGFQLESEAQAGVFLGSGAATLILLLGEVRHRLRTERSSDQGRFSLSQLSTLNTARNPGRSTLTIGLVAAASFLIISVSAFRLETGEAGTGGFELLATSDQPLHYDLNTPEGRLELGFPDRASRQLDAWRIFSLRVASGEDASCLNLYRPAQPRVLGVPADLIARGGFAWTSAQSDATNPWTLLDAELGEDERRQPIIPVVIDASTAIYSLHLRGVGDRFAIRDAADRLVTLQVVGMLKNSVLQGSLLVSEANFLRIFPDVAGYRFFLIERSGQSRSPAGAERSASDREDVAALLEGRLADVGFDAIDAREQLAGYLAVQNTYLSTFQSLGALGLCLGTIGLAAVQLRSVLERRGELALMRAAGFRPARLTWMVVWENAVLLVGGLAIGCIAATVALVPQWAPQQASVPWLALATLLGVIAAVGILAGWLATRSALQSPILPALRGD